MGTARLNHKCGRQLASGTASDLGLWSPEQKSVSKRKAELYLTFIALCFGQRTPFPSAFPSLFSPSQVRKKCLW